jgi:hypothetical protein
MNLVLYRNALAGSNTGGIQKTQDMIDFCALNKIKPELTKISMNGIDDARKRFSTSKFGIASSSIWEVDNAIHFLRTIRSRVSRLCLGTMSVGYVMALNAGINFFDTADVYGGPQ